MAWNTSTRRQRLPKDWPQRRRTVLERDPTCRLRYPGCTTTSTEVDHRNPGDDHSLSNLQGACSPCHGRKSRWEAAQARKASGAMRQQSPQRPGEPHPGLT